MVSSFLKLNKLERGSAGIMVLLVMTVLLTVGSALVTRSTTESEITSNYTDGVSAQYLAEAGIQHARAEIIAQKYIEDIDNSKLQNISLGNGHYDVTVSYMGGLHYQVISVGSVNNASRKIVAIMKKDTVYELRIVRYSDNLNNLL